MVALGSTRCRLVVEQNLLRADIESLIARHREHLVGLHFGGHADATALHLEDTGGQPDALDADRLAQALAGCAELRWIFLNGCTTAGQVEVLQDCCPVPVVATGSSVRDEAAWDAHPPEHAEDVRVALLARVVPGRAAAYGGHYARAADVLGDALPRLAGSTDPDTRLHRSGGLMAWSHALFAQGRYVEATTVGAEGVALCEALAEKGEPGRRVALGIALANLAQTHAEWALGGKKAQWPEVERLARRCLAILDLPDLRRERSGAAALAMALDRLGQACIADGRAPEAVEWARQATVFHREAAGGEPSATWAMGVHDLSCWQVANGEADAAIATARRAVALAEAAPADRQRPLTIARCRAAEIQALCAVGRLSEALTAAKAGLVALKEHVQLGLSQWVEHLKNMRDRIIQAMG